MINCSIYHVCKGNVQPRRAHEGPEDAGTQIPQHWNYIKSSQNTVLFYLQQHVSA